MASPQRPAAKTASRATPETARGTHAFEVTGYSQHKGLGVRKFIRSDTFAVGGYDWCIRFYPDGYNEDSTDYVSVFLELLSKEATMRALYGFRLVNQVTGLSRVICRVLSPKAFNSPLRTTWGFQKFKKRSNLEASRYLHDNRLVIECDVTIIKEPQVEKTIGKPVEVQVPPSDLLDNLKELLYSEEQTDVTFMVKGEVFRAHKIVLAMRSRVFKAELYGPMRDNRRRAITVEDMQPTVFKAMLHFIYTDSLPSVDDLDGDENKEMVKHLLVAADRYAMERMKSMCEDILCKSLDPESVATIFALADQHQCIKLKDACINFINSTNSMGKVVESEGYRHLKRTCPAVFLEIWEETAKSRKV